MTCLVVHNVHSDFSDYNSLMHGSLGAVTAAFWQAAIAIGIGGRFLTFGSFVNFPNVAWSDSS